MFYKLLGMVVWNGVKWVLRLKFGSSASRKPLLAGAVVALALVLGGAGAAVKARSDS